MNLYLFSCCILIIVIIYYLEEVTNLITYIVKLFLSVLISFIISMALSYFILKKNGKDYKRAFVFFRTATIVFMSLYFFEFFA
ncbi:DUF4229 domain-containing protein [Anaerosphaera aminiphila]|uniref:DUF4229 domain-containing protein n=1 Tax=Anaerosphaera aminiphila TaxID=1120994 RepID=UPI003899640F